MSVAVDDRYRMSFVFLLLVNRVSMQSVAVNATLGSAVILPCSADQDTQSAYWRYSDSLTVFDIIGGEENVDEQDPAYRDRVESFPSEYAKGNFSIKLRKLTQSDTGAYTCHFLHTLTPRTVRLNVTEAKSGNVVRTPGSRSLFLLGCVLLSTWTKVSR